MYSRGGDVFILIFSGSQRLLQCYSSQQPAASFIIKAASNAGAAAETAEARKDFCHADRVTAAGGVFLSICCGNSWFLDTIQSRVCAL